MDQANAVPRERQFDETLKRAADTASKLSPNWETGAAAPVRDPRERLLGRLEAAEDQMIRGLARIRGLKSQVKYAGLRDADLIADLVEQFAQMNFLNSI